MKPLGHPFTIQNTVEHGWLITWTNAVVHGTLDAPHESVSFTVAIPRSVNLSVGEVQTFALKRAAELLRVVIQSSQDIAQ